jgi:chemotaxis protein CheX
MRRAAKPTPPKAALPKAASLTLPAEFNVSDLQPLVDRLLQARGRRLELEGSQVERIGGLGLQVLISARKTWLADGQKLSLANPSPALEDALALAGVGAVQS